MNKVTVTLNQEQAQKLVDWLSYDANLIQNYEYPKSDASNASVERIRQRILKALDDK